MAAIQHPEFELTNKGRTKVGVLVPENERAMRLVVIDERYRLLDGSRFPSVRQAEMTVQRLSNFVDHPAHGQRGLRTGHARNVASLLAGLATCPCPISVSRARSIRDHPCLR